MIRRCFAWWLLLLIATPFTAPFATCDLLTALDHRDRSIRTLDQTDALVGAANRETHTIVQAPDDTSSIASPFIEESSKACEIAFRCNRVTRLDRPALRVPLDTGHLSDSSAAHSTVLRL
jgi:hypothetical protein